MNKHLCALMTALVASASSPTFAVEGASNPTGKLSSVFIAVGAANLAIAVVNHNKAIGLFNLGIGIYLLDDQNQTVQFSRVSTVQAQGSGLSEGEMLSVNQNLPVINAILTSSLAESRKRGFDDKGASRAFEQELGANLDKTTLQAFNRLRDSMAKQVEASINEM